MKEIFNYAIALALMLAIGLCVISPADVYASVNDIKAASSDEYVTTVKDAGIVLRKGMVNRKKTVEISYKMLSSNMSENKWFANLSDDILEYALMHTGNPKEGDSIKYNLKNYETKGSYYTYGGYTYISIIFTNTYYSTAAQEKTLDSHVEMLKSKLNTDDKSDYEIVKVIYDYICSNVVYNKGTSELKYTAYNALVNKSAVCQGYATLFYRLCLEYDIDVRVITGKGKASSHAWNIVEIEDKFYNTDCTWDAGFDEYNYFLVGASGFKDHIRNSEFLTASFTKEYPITNEDYSCTNHQWNEFYTIDKYATYAASGSKSIHCSICDEKKEDSIIKLPKLVCRLNAPKTVTASLTAKFGTFAGYDDLKVTWSKVEGASGYHIKYRKKGTTEWKSSYTTYRYMFIKNLQDGVRYEVSVCPYVKQNGVKYRSSNKTIAVSDYTLKSVKITEKKKNIGNKVTFRWKGINGETGYQIFRSKTKNGKYVKVGTLKKSEGTSHKIKLTAKKGVTYWYKVRAYKTVSNSKCVFGPWSQKVKFIR